MHVYLPIEDSFINKFNKYQHCTSVVKTIIRFYFVNVKCRTICLSCYLLDYPVRIITFIAFTNWKFNLTRILDMDVNLRPVKNSSNVSIVLKAYIRFCFANTSNVILFVGLSARIITLITIASQLKAQFNNIIRHGVNLHSA